MTRRINILMITVFFEMLVIPLQGQVPYFRKINITGVSTDFKVRAICQDSLKVIWLGTNEGLYRFDGLNFVMAELPPLPGKANISALSAIPGNGIMAGTQSGTLFTVFNGNVKVLTSDSVKPQASVSSIGVDTYGSVWIGTRGDGVYKYHQGKFRHIDSDDGIGDNYIYTVCVIDSVIWLGSDRGISAISDRKDGLRVTNITTRDGLPENIVRNIIRGPGSTIGIGMEEKGFCLYDYSANLFNYPPYFKEWSSGPVTAVTLLENEFWMGTLKQGITDYEFRAGKRIRQFSRIEGFRGIDISCIVTDHEGNVWIGAGNELYMSPGEKIEYLHTIGELKLGNIRSILVDDDDNIWYSNEFGVHYFNRNYSRTQKITDPLKGTAFGNYSVISFYQDHHGYIWMGTFDKGVIRYDTQTGRFLIFNEDHGLINPNVLSIDGDENEIWFATLGGVSKCSFTDSTLNGVGNFTGFSEENGLGNNFIYKVFIDSKGVVWFGTDGKGVTCYKNGMFTNFNESHGLKSSVIYSITEDSQGHIWVSSVDEGLYKFNGSVFTNFSQSDGLSDLNISAISVDDRGNLMVIHRKGIDIVDPDGVRVVSYGNEVGLTDIDPDINVIDVDSKGNTWIGIRDGIVKLSFGERAGSHEPVVVLNRILSFLLQSDTAGQVSFAHDKNHISFDYFAIWYTNPEAVSYRYKLDGYNDEWVTTRDRFITFPNLRPGKYRFSITASHNGSYNYDDAVSLDFVINQPFWEQSWFIVLLMALTAAAVSIYLRYRDKRIKAMEVLNRERIESQFEVLRNQVNPHFLFNSFNTLISVIESDKNVAVEYVNKLSDFFRSILAYRDTDLISLKDELHLVDDYIFLQQKRYGTNFRVSVQMPDTLKETSFVPPLAIQTLLENALKHNAVSVESPLTCELLIEDNNYLIVRNNINVRLQKEPSTGLGLQNVRNRYKLLTGY